MAGYEIGNLVRSKAGHDKGGYFIIIRADAEYVYLADGKTRGLDKLKRKKIKHVQPTGIADGALREKLRNSGRITDEEIRFFLKEWNRKNHENHDNPGR